MRIGFDVDGVLADFDTAFGHLLEQMTNEYRLPPNWDTDPNFPPVWHWPEHYGYTLEQTREAFGQIKQDPQFWETLQPLEDARPVLTWISDNQHEHDLYFITDRAGVTAKRQTEWWLDRCMSIPFPTVLISAHKDWLAAALMLDVYIDDRRENCNSAASYCRVYMPARLHNRGLTDPQVRRVSSPVEMLKEEGLL